MLESVFNLLNKGNKEDFITKALIGIRCSEMMEYNEL